MLCCGFKVKCPVTGTKKHVQFLFLPCFYTTLSFLSNPCFTGVVSEHSASHKQSVYYIRTPVHGAGYVMQTIKCICLQIMHYSKGVLGDNIVFCM